MKTIENIKLPGLDCGACGYRSCEAFSKDLAARPELLDRCIHLSSNTLTPAQTSQPTSSSCSSACCGTPCGPVSARPMPTIGASSPWVDSLGREFDFYLEHFPEDPGPREIILPHNPLITRELDIKVGDTLIGRPLGMSCGCPITHCGVATAVDQRNCVVTWCVTGPLGPRAHGYKDLGYYIAEAYEGIITETRQELRIGGRHFFQPRMCMLQWRHSGLINYLNRLPNGWQVRLEGLFIG